YTSLYFSSYIILFHPLYFSFFFFSCYRDHRDLHSFPTTTLFRSGRPPFGWSNPRWSSSAGSPASIESDATRITRRFDSARSKPRSEEHTSELQSRGHLVCRLLLEKKKKKLMTNKTKK